MPDQLIFRGLCGGVSVGGGGGVGKTPCLLPALATRLEQLSYLYQSLSPAAEARPTSSYRIVDVQNLRHYVLTRIKESGLDDLGRPTFMAHHLVFSGEELAQILSRSEHLLTPPQIFLRWSGWLNILWKGPPRLHDPLSESNLFNLQKDCAPARRWDFMTGDAANALGLLRPDFAGHIPLDDANIPETNALELLSESLQMLETRDALKFRRGSAWDITFTTNLQPDDALTDFYWPLTRKESRGFEKFCATDHPAAVLAKIRRHAASEDEMAFARLGRTPLKITHQPALPATPLKAGDKVPFKVEARCLPASPISYSWCKLDANGQPEQPPLALGTHVSIVVPAKGARLVAGARNREGVTVWSEPLDIQVGASAGSATASKGKQSPADADRPRRLAPALLLLLLLAGGAAYWTVSQSRQADEEAALAEAKQRARPVPTNTIVAKVEPPPEPLPPPTPPPEPVPATNMAPATPPPEPPPATNAPPKVAKTPKPKPTTPPPKPTPKKTPKKPVRRH